MDEHELQERVQHSEEVDSEYQNGSDHQRQVSGRPCICYAHTSNYYTVWPEILAGIYFGGLLKFLYLAEFTLAVWKSLCHNDIHSKMANPDEQS